MVKAIDDRSRPSKICVFCSRLRSVESRQCDAFPNRIPMKVWKGRDPHTEEIDGDNGLLFNWIDEPDGQESDLVI